MTMHSYRAKVRDAAIKRDGTPLYNGSLDHAAVLAEAMFEHAGEEVCIFSGNFNAFVYGDPNVLKRAEQFLADRDHRVRVILEDPKKVDPRDHPFFKKFGFDKENGFKRDDIDFKCLPKNISDEINYHFMVMDSDSYRFEENKDHPSAIASFGDKIGGENLSQIFNDLWSISENCNFTTN